MNRFGHYVYEPVWRTRTHLIDASVPDNLACWLFDQGSLTRRLQERCQGTFSVRVISQAWQRPMLNEAQRLGMADNRLALIRQVYLLCDDTPWVYARTVIPRSSLGGPRRHLASLGSKPLGAVLFADPNMQRDEVEVACIRQGQRIFNSAVQALTETPAQIWGRRSVFYLGNKPLLVNEVFLPDILQCNKQI